MSQTIRWGMIGAGDVTEVKSGPALYKAKNSQLVAVMRRSGTLAQDYARRHGVPRWYDNVDELINDPEVDAVYIATPPHVHKAYTLKAAQAGKPVYVEKPMALNFQECQDMIQACQAAGVSLWVAYYRRALPRFHKIKALVHDGAIGEVQAVTTTLYRPPSADEMNAANPAWRVVPEIAGGGIFVDVGVHMLDFLDDLLGPVRSVTGFAANLGGHYAAEDQVSASLVFESGVVGSGLWSFTSGQRTDSTTLIGTRGTIQYATFNESPLVLTTDAGTQAFTIENPRHIQQPLIQSIVDELNGQGQCPSTGVSAARTTWVTDQLLADYYQRTSH
jgi:predicted dehydrogenase